MAGGATTALRAGGTAGIAGAAVSPLCHAAASLRERFDAGGRAVTGGAQSTESGAASAGETSGPPVWASRMRRSQTISRGVSAADHVLRSGDHASGGSSIDLSEGA